MLTRLYQWTLAKAAHRHAERWLFAVSFMESSFFPIPPHPLLGLMCLAAPKRALRYGLICTVASVLGGLFGYSIGYFLYDSVGQWMLSALGLAEGFPRAACYLRENAFWLIVAKGATPIPFKLVTITSGFVGVNLLTFIAASIIATYSGYGGERWPKPLQAGSRAAKFTAIGPAEIVNAIAAKFPSLVVAEAESTADHALRLVRPDGYVGFAGTAADHHRAEAYLITLAA